MLNSSKYSRVGDINPDSRNAWIEFNWERLTANYGSKFPGCTEFDAADAVVYKGREKTFVSKGFAKYALAEYERCVSNRVRHAECVTNGMKLSTRKRRSDNDDRLPGSLDGAKNLQNDFPGVQRTMAVCVVPEPEEEAGAGDILAPFPLPVVAPVVVVAAAAVVAPPVLVAPVIRAPLVLPLKKRMMKEEEKTDAVPLPLKKRVRFDLSPDANAKFDAVKQRLDAEFETVKQSLHTELTGVRLDVRASSLDGLVQELFYVNSGILLSIVGRRVALPQLCI